MLMLEKVLLCMAVASFFAWLVALVFEHAGPWLRKQPAIKIISVVAMAGFGAILTQKPMGGSGGGSTQTVVTQQKQPVVLTLIQGQLPEWWVFDPTDTDGDGIPDLWELWTGTDPLVADSHLDLTGDGLTNLEKFWHHLDPRVSSTLNDGLSDFVKIQHGLDPLSQEIFVVDEPDENNNGVIDIWEGSGYRYGFMDTSGNGFDDRYELVMPGLNGTGDVELRVATSRSAALLWGGESLVLPAGDHRVRVRVPLDADTHVSLKPAPPGVDVSGPWKAGLDWRWHPLRHPGNKCTRLFWADENGFLEGSTNRAEIATILGSPPNSAQGFQVMSTQGGPPDIYVDFVRGSIIISNNMQSVCVRHGGNGVFHATVVGTVIEELEWYPFSELYGEPEHKGRVFNAMATGRGVGTYSFYCGEKDWVPSASKPAPIPTRLAPKAAHLHVYDCKLPTTNVLGVAQHPTHHTPTNEHTVVYCQGIPLDNLTAYLGYEHINPIITSNLFILAWYADPQNHDDADAYKLTHHSIKELFWSAGGSVNLAALLAPNAQPYMDKVYFTAQERLVDVLGLGEVYQNGKKFEVENHILKFDEKPLPRKPTIYHVELRYRDKPEVFDRLWVVVNRPDSKELFDHWVSINTDTSWTANLPKVYPKVQYDYWLAVEDPEKGPPHLWEAPKRKTSLLHHSPGVVRCEMLTEQLPGGHGNQAWYDEKGVLIEEPPFLAGRARKFAPNSSNNPLNMRHNDNEIYPLVLALQLDGNPVHAIIRTEFTGTGSIIIGGNEVTISGAPMEFFQNLTSPCIYLGDNANEYLGKRPVHPTGKLNQ